jgi:hypothetical protein
VSAGGQSAGNRLLSAGPQAPGSEEGLSCLSGARRPRIASADIHAESEGAAPVRRLILAMLGAGALLALGAPVASAHIGTATITCTSVTFNYSNFEAGSHTILEEVFFDHQPVVVASTNFTFSGSSGGPSTLTIAVPQDGQSHHVAAFASENGVLVQGFENGIRKDVNCSPPCPKGTGVNFRWHYSSNGTSGSWSGTKTATCPSFLTMGPQAMEGDLKVAPGQIIKVGYSLTIPGNKSNVFVTVINPNLTFTVRCQSGATPSASTFTVSMPTQTYIVTNSSWFPSGDQHSPLVYQGSIAAPDLCGGGNLRLDKGGTFKAAVT